MRKGVRRALIALPALYALACRADGRFARAARDGFGVPAMRALHRLGAPVPFPVSEPLALALAAALALSLAAAGVRCLSTRSLRPLRPALAGIGRTALLLGGALIALWAPARAATDAEAPPAPTAAQLERLCGELVDALNASPLIFPDRAETLRAAPRVAGLPGCAVKAARYPEWMRAAEISGLFVPLTGEALVDAGEPAPLVPFTAVHELTHLSGIADEGAANIAAWERCLSAGGAFADSARLWALRYALGLLRRSDSSAWLRSRAKMEGALERTFQFCGGEISADQTPPGLFPLSLSRGSYADLARYLARD